MRRRNARPGRKKIMIALMFIQLAAILLYLSIRALFPELFIAGVGKSARSHIKHIIAKHTYPVNRQFARQALCTQSANNYR
jgi:voltage-gated potassium channel Kch